MQVHVLNSLRLHPLRNRKNRFYLDVLSGQNNSLVKDFEVFRKNQQNAFLDPQVPQEVRVEMVRLDDFVRDSAVKVAFVKIDVEGAELSVLQGMRNILTEQRPRLMVEVQADEAEVLRYLTMHGYCLFDQDLRRLHRPDELKNNVFCLHREAHRELAMSLGARFS